MDDRTANGLVRQILFEIDRLPSITEAAVAAQCADAMVAHQYFTSPAVDYLQALDVVLAAGPLPQRALDSSRRFGADELSAFLHHLRDDLRGRQLPAAPA